MVIVYMTDPPFPAMFVGIMAVCFNMSGAIAEDALRDLGTPLSWVPCSCAPFAVGVFVFQAVFPPIGEVCDTCIKYGVGNVRGYGGIVEDAWLESLISIGTSQHSEGVVFFPSHIPVEPFKFCQVFCKVGHLLMCIVESLDLPS